MRKTVVILTYYDRPQQLMKTLSSIGKTEHDNFSVLVIDDKSKEYPAFNMQFGTKFTVEVIYNGDKDWSDPSISKNRGIQRAIEMGAEVIIMQGAECMWIGDILMATEDLLDRPDMRHPEKRMEYISFACYSLDAPTTALLDHKPHDFINQVIAENNVEATADGQNAWYNHPVRRDKYYDFCCAISVENIKKLNGYDERYAQGIAYSDDDWVMRIKRLGLQMAIPNPENCYYVHDWSNKEKEGVFIPKKIQYPYVVHQHHYSAGGSQYDQTEKVERNQTLYHQLGSDGSGNYRAKHILTQDFEKI